MRTPEQIVQAEVCCCLSGLVSTLAAGVYLDVRIARDHDAGAALQNLFASAAELAAPVNSREAFEHWAVTDWLADQLIAKGEKVDKDFTGLCVWARTTTDQMISADSVFESIAADLNKAG